ncbi:FecR domain-containing protein [Pseudomonas sp. SC11]|uniref:FecR domain-containing protein n=1 Tax=Pseudomonas sp. SC11 TaxID=326927 RepID=UPI003999EB83
MTEATCPHQALAQRQAADWFALLSSGEAGEHERRQWLDWRQAAPVHEAAWCQVEEVVSRFQSLPPALAQHTLNAPALDRRAALKLLATLLAIGGAAAAGMRSELAQQTFADLSTGAGERRSWTLPDHTHLHLNARSAASVQFEGRRRQIRLYSGDFMFQVQGRSDLHPLQITTEHGRVEAEAARFMVSQRAGRVAVSLFEGALRLQPDTAPWQALGAGQSALLQPGRGVSLGPLQPQVAAWERGLVFAEGMPLRHYLAQLAPYRTGLLSCDAVAGRLRVSGVFSLDHSDRLLAQLPDILPVRVRYFSRYWVRVEALG